MAQMRREELEGFVEGIYGEHKIIDLPQSAGESLNTLAEIRAMLEGVCQIVADESKQARSTDHGGLIRNHHELTKIAERAMHEVVRTCGRARRQMEDELQPANPPLHTSRPGSGRS